jgi:hypothetical protein
MIMNNNKIYINDPRVIRTEKNMVYERLNYSQCPMESTIPCETNQPNQVEVSKDIIKHEVNNELFRGIQEPNLLNTAFFSLRNRQNIQNGIRRHVYEISQEKYLIGPQSDQELMNIMRYIFLEHSLNSMQNIKEQIKDLNDRIIKESVLKILPNIKFHQYYLNDNFAGRTLMERPKNLSVYGTKTTPFLNKF